MKKNNKINFLNSPHVYTLHLVTKLLVSSHDVKLRLLQNVL